MMWTIPGTVLQGNREEAASIASVFSAMFLPGDMALSQAAAVSGLEPYMIQNWVKRGYLSPPRAKRYSMNQLCRILNINMLRGCLQMDQICGLLAYINGALDDESDDLITDSQLYFLFVRLAADARQMGSDADWEQHILSLVDSCEETVPGSRQRIYRVLRVMLTAWIACRMRQEAEQMLQQLEEIP